jgi:hypothetical protein
MNLAGPSTAEALWPRSGAYIVTFAILYFVVSAIYGALFVIHRSNYRIEQDLYVMPPPLFPLRKPRSSQPSEDLFVGRTESPAAGHIAVYADRAVAYS